MESKSYADPRIDYAPKSVAGSRVSYNDVAPVVQTNLSLTGLTEHEFKIPNSVYNLAQSKIRFTLTVPGVAAATSAYIRDDCWSMINRMSFRDSSDNVLFELADVHRYTKAVLPAVLPDAEFQSRTTGSPATTVAASKYGNPYSRGFGGAASKQNFIPTGAGDRPAVVATYDRDLPQRYQASAANSILAVTYELPLADLCTSPFGVNKNLYFNQTMKLVVTFNPTNQFVLSGATATFALPGDPADIPVVAAIGSSLKFVVAQESDEMIAAAVKGAVLSGQGLSLTVPITSLVKRNNVGGQQNDHSFNLNRAHGMKHRAILVSNFPTATTLADIGNNTNIDGAEVTSVRTSYDGRYIQPSALLYGTNMPTAYTWGKDLFAGSCIQSVRRWEHEGALHIEDFGVGKLTNLYTDPTVSRGMPYRSEVSVISQVTTPAGKTPTSYFFILGEEKLNLSRNGISLGPVVSANSNPLSS